MNDSLLYKGLILAELGAPVSSSSILEDAGTGRSTVALSAGLSCPNVVGLLLPPCLRLWV